MYRENQRHSDLFRQPDDYWDRQSLIGAASPLIFAVVMEIPGKLLRYNLNLIRSWRAAFKRATPRRFADAATPAKITAVSAVPEPEPIAAVRVEGPLAAVRNRDTSRAHSPGPPALP
jgi:hypothetical protein